jgi:hypothetical protein
MRKEIKRRDFLKASGQLGLAGCALMFCGNVNAAEALLAGDEVPDPKKLNYCGYTCPEKCDFLMATINNDPEAKKACFEQWHIKERYGLEYDEKTAFCWGCKVEDKPEGVVLNACTVRSCCKEKGFDCCIECKELSSCDKDLWTRFPKFYDGVKKLQQKYFDARG